MARACEEFFSRNDLGHELIQSEKKLDFCALIPDNSINQADHVFCVEYTWRTGDYLVGKNRSGIAVYVLKKLQNYARELGWEAA